MRIPSSYTIQDDINDIGKIPVIPQILEVICRTTGMGFAAIARVTDDKWVACAVRDEINFGLEIGGELKLETTICHEIRQTGDHVVIDHVAQDEYFNQHHTPLMYGFQSYISIPIRLKDGTFFGTLCSIDPRPAVLNTPANIGMFRLFADLVALHLNAIREQEIVEARLLEEQKISELREQFIAILGHDLRNPVQATLNGAQLLMGMPLDKTGLRIANIIQDSSYRINGLIENMLDFASGRMGGGIALQRKKEDELPAILTEIVSELSVVWPDREIVLDIDLDGPVYLDGKRVAQLFSNLLGNALNYGDKDQPILTSVRIANNQFTLSVSNAGPKIPSGIMHRLFQPFSRGEGKGNKQGLGLGLYIASEIASAHGGT
ncbi:MAG: GAF domain-containing sensor histidine kinase, partial [Chitinophagaceae bacterium]